mgnify:CR=1 FL=1
MYSKKSGRMTFKTRRPNYKRNNNFSNSKGRSKGNVTQQYNKYLKLAKEAFTSGDRIQSEYFYQFTEHYYRIMAELGINIEENVGTVAVKNENIETNENIDENENQEISDQKIETQDQNNPDENIDDSIESVPFISEPIKKKRARSNK